jgi:hypothetical protein
MTDRYLEPMTMPADHFAIQLGRASLAVAGTRPQWCDESERYFVEIQDDKTMKRQNHAGLSSGTFDFGCGSFCR